LNVSIGYPLPNVQAILGTYRSRHRQPAAEDIEVNDRGGESAIGVPSQEPRSVENFRHSTAGRNA
jgi:hypothetical protein